MVDKYCIIDCRIVCFDIPPQKVLTKDSITVDVDAVVLYRVHNAIVAVTNVENYSKATEFLAAIHLRNILGTKTLTQILSESFAINEDLQVSTHSIHHVNIYLAWLFQCVGKPGHRDRLLGCEGCPHRHQERKATVESSDSDVG